MAASLIQPLTRAQRHALGKVAMRCVAGKQTTDAQYPTCIAAFAVLEQARLIELDAAGSYRPTPAGAREIMTWRPSARPVSVNALQTYICDYTRDRMDCHD